MSNPTQYQPLTDGLREGIADYIEGEIRRGIQRQADIAADFPGFLADPNPAPVPLRFAKGITRQVCRAWARGKTPIQGPFADAIYGPTCEPYLGTIGEAPTRGAVSGIPFIGGQCPGVSYDVRWSGWTANVLVCDSGVTAQQNQGGNNRVGGRSYLGPITSMGVEYEGQQRCGYIRAVLRIVSAEGTFTPLITSVPNGNPTLITSVIVNGLQAVRVGGGTECGNPPPGYKPPETRPGLPTLPPFVPSDGPLAGQPVNVSFDNDGNINVSVPGLGVDVTVPNPLKDDVPADEIPPGEQGTAGDEGAETGTGDEGEDETRNLVGVLVRLRNIPPRANALFNQDGTVYKGACFVYFGGAAGLTLNPDALFCRQEQFFYAPKGCNRWRVVPNVGYTLTVQPFYED